MASALRKTWRIASAGAFPARSHSFVWSANRSARRAQTRSSSTSDRTPPGCLVPHQVGPRHVVAIAPPFPLRMARGHRPAIAVAQSPGEQADVPGVGSNRLSRYSRAQPGLDRVPQLLRDNGGMLAGERLALVDGVTQVDAVGEQVVERAAIERAAAAVRAAGAVLDLGAMPCGIELIGQLRHRRQRQVARA